jgi:predicted TPR repeat methyltransferase
MEGRNITDEKISNKLVWETMPGPVRITEDDASQYDHFCELMEWHGHQELFAMMREYVRPGQSVLDLGTGTGLMAALFHAAGLRVYGVDSSEEMLKVCAKKAVAEELKVYDLSRPDWPYGRETFDHVTACGLLHFIRDPGVFFSEAYRVLKPRGCLGFTVKGVIDDKEEYVDAGSGVEIFCQRESGVERLMAGHGLTLLKRMVYGTYNDLDKKEKSFFIIYVAKKTR